MVEDQGGELAALGAAGCCESGTQPCLLLGTGHVAHCCSWLFVGVRGLSSTGAAGGGVSRLLLPLVVPPADCERDVM